jgi:hypothetical protein
VTSETGWCRGACAKRLFLKVRRLTQAPLQHVGHFRVAVIVLDYLRWQTIAGESQESPEESPNTIRQHAA